MGKNRDGTNLFPREIPDSSLVLNRSELLIDH